MFHICRVESPILEYCTFKSTDKHLTTQLPCLLSIFFSYSNLPISQYVEVTFPFTCLVTLCRVSLITATTCCSNCWYSFSENSCFMISFISILLNVCQQLFQFSYSIADILAFLLNGGHKFCECTVILFSSLFYPGNIKTCFITSHDFINAISAPTASWVTLGIVCLFPC